MDRKNKHEKAPVAKPTASLAWLILGVLMVGCVPLGEQPIDIEPQPTMMATIDIGNVEEMSTPDHELEFPTGEVPIDVFEIVLNDLLGRTGSDRSSVSVIKAEAVVWKDGSLGCPQPGVMYTQALVNGYLIVFMTDGEEYDYHVSENGIFVLCENNLGDRFQVP